MFDAENLKALVQFAWVPRAISAFGAAGEDAVTSLLDGVRLLFQRIPPEALRGPLTVVRGVAVSTASPLIACWGRVERLSGYPALGSRLARVRDGSFACVEIMADGSLGFVEREGEVDLVATAEEAVVYRYEARSDRILARGHDIVVPKVSSILASVFCNPTLDSLSAALERYAEFARETNCHILSTAWEGGVEGPRLVLVNKPEAIMRRSLSQALSLMLRDVSVRPEQNTDESKPVDIRVEWFASGASALIEIKWLGRSTAKPRSPTDGITYTEYDAPRARAGAKQLADYMDRQVRNSNATAPKGYLIVFDARRRNVAGRDDALAETDALFYENDAIAYSPDYAAIRPDFNDPVRFFLMPRRSHFKEAA